MTKTTQSPILLVELSQAGVSSVKNVKSGCIRVHPIITSAKTQFATKCSPQATEQQKEWFQNETNISIVQNLDLIIMPSRSYYFKSYVTETEASSQDKCQHIPLHYNLKISVEIYSIYDRQG